MSFSTNSLYTARPISCRSYAKNKKNAYVYLSSAFKNNSKGAISNQTSTFNEAGVE